MAFANDTANHDKSGPAPVRATSRDIAADFRQIGLVMSLLVASLLCFLSVNDFRTSLSLLHVAVDVWPRAQGWPLLHQLTRCHL